jgi:hypothetical protein
MLKTTTTSFFDGCMQRLPWKQGMVFILFAAFMAFSSTLSADITAANASGTYVNNGNGTYRATINVTFTSTTVE